MDALPEDVKKELLSFYESEAVKANPRHQRQHQHLLTDSARKPKPVLTSKKPNLTPSKNHKASTLLSRGRPSKTTSKSSNSSSLTQSNFIANTSNKNVRPPRADRSAVQSASDHPEPEPEPLPSPSPSTQISESFLSALPPDLRREILDQQKRDRLKERSGLDISTSNTRNRPPSNQQRSTEWLLGATGQQKLIIPPRPEIPTFTSRKLSTIEELRDAMERWVREFSSTGTDTGTGAEASGQTKGGGEKGDVEELDEQEEPGPYPEDVEALATYLAKVVTLEANMDKAVSVVVWLTWLVGELPEEGQQKPWSAVLQRLRDGVRHAVRERGLGDVDFGS